MPPVGVVVADGLDYWQGGARSCLTCPSGSTGGLLPQCNDPNATIEPYCINPYKSLDVSMRISFQPLLE